VTVNTLPSIHRDPGPSLPSLERSPGSPTIPVIVIIIEPELEFAEVESWEAVASILAGLSLLAGSAAPGEEAPPKNKRIARTEAKHTNLTHRLNVPSSHPAQAALNRRDLFSQKNSSREQPPQCPLQSSRSGCLQPYTPTAMTMSSATIKSGRAQNIPTAAAIATPSNTFAPIPSLYRLPPTAATRPTPDSLRFPSWNRTAATRTHHRP